MDDALLWCGMLFLTQKHIKIGKNIKNGVNVNGKEQNTSYGFR